jgi:hypothetical protein
MKSIKNLPVYVLSGALIFVGISNSSQASGASTISQLEKRIKVLEGKNQTLELTTTVLVKWVKELRGCYVPVTATVNQNVVTGGANLALCIKQ